MKYKYKIGDVVNFKDFYTTEKQQIENRFVIKGLKPIANTIVESYIIVPLIRYGNMNYVEVETYIDEYYIKLDVVYMRKLKLKKIYENRLFKTPIR